MPGTSRQNGSDPPADSTLILQGIRALHQRLDELERRVAPGERVGQHPDQGGRLGFVPAWKRPTEGEARWQAAAAVAIAIALQFPLPGRLVLLQPVWLLPVLEGLLLLALIMVNPRHINRESRAIRMLSLTLAAILSLANAWSVARLVIDLVQGTEGNAAGPLLATGGVIWLTNVIIFALWYWEFDRGGPVARANATHIYPDFLFVQMTSPHLAPPRWEPAFGDYLYLSFTNATAFSPTDVMPLSRWAKMAMTAQASISIVTVVLVVARAVNILKLPPLGRHRLGPHRAERNAEAYHWGHAERSLGSREAAVRLRPHRRNLVVWSQSAPAGRYGVLRRTPFRRIRRWIRTSALLTVIGLMSFASGVRARWRPVLAGVVLTTAGVILRNGPGNVVLLPGLVFLVYALLMPGRGDEDRLRRSELERELAGYSTPAQRRDLEAILDQYPDGITRELRDILARQPVAAGDNRFPGSGPA